MHADAKNSIAYDIAHEYAAIAEKETQRHDGIVFPGDDKKAIKNKTLFVKMLMLLRSR